MNRSVTLLDRLHSHIMHDRFLTAALTVYFTISALMILLASIAVWPVTITFLHSDTMISGLCQTLFRANLPLMIVYIVISGLFMLFERNFSFLKTTLINVIIGSLVNLVVLLVSKDLVQGPGIPSFMFSLLWFIISFLFSWILAILPSALACGVAKLIHVIFFKIHEWRHGG